MKENTTAKVASKKKKFFTTANMVSCAMLSACAIILSYLEFPVPFLIPDFIRFSISDMPALIGAFSIGPLAGVVIELLKSLMMLIINPANPSMGIGELSNFVLGCAFVLPAAYIYRCKKTKKIAIIALITGGLISAVTSVFMNAFVNIPLYEKLMNFPFTAIQATLPEGMSFIDTLWEFCLFSVFPFNLIKVTVVSIITIFIYKPLSVLIKGFN